jgi:hypothetical protein
VCAAFERHDQLLGRQRRWTGVSPLGLLHARRRGRQSYMCNA